MQVMTSIKAMAVEDGKSHKRQSWYMMFTTLRLRLAKHRIRQYSAFDDALLRCFFAMWASHIAMEKGVPERLPVSQQQAIDVDIE